MSDLSQAAYLFFGLGVLALGIKNIATGGPTLIGGEPRWKAFVKKTYRPIGAFQVLMGIASIWFAFTA